METLGWLDLQHALTLAEAWALVGDRDRALAWLEKAIERGFANYPFLARLDPFLESVRDDPRFQALLPRVERQFLLNQSGALAT